MSATRCLTTEEAKRFIAAELPAPRMYAINEHCNYCVVCDRFVAALVARHKAAAA